MFYKSFASFNDLVYGLNQTEDRLLCSLTLSEIWQRVMIRSFKKSCQRIHCWYIKCYKAIRFELVRYHTTSKIKDFLSHEFNNELLINFKNLQQWIWKKNHNTPRLKQWLALSCLSQHCRHRDVMERHTYTTRYRIIKL